MDGKYWRKQHFKIEKKVSDTQRQILYMNCFWSTRLRGNIYEHKQKTSKYRGVHWHKNCRRWEVKLQGQKPKYGGTFNDEMDAAKRVNELCEELGIPPKNPGISGKPNHPYQVTKKFV